MEAFDKSQWKTKSNRAWREHRVGQAVNVFCPLDKSLPASATQVSENV